MVVNNNWDPNSGPPGGNDNALFTTDENPPILYPSDSMELNNIEFFVPGVVCTIEGDLIIDNDVQNATQITSVFNMQSGTFTLHGGSLATGGVSIYNLDASTLTVATPNQSNAIVNLTNGSLFRVQDALTIGSLASTSFSDSIALRADLTFGDSSDQTINGLFSGTGNLTKQGSGSVSLYGLNTFNGATSVVAGRLNVNGQVPGDVTVFSGATVGGTGLIGGTLLVENGASFSPGNSIGTISVGTLMLADGSTTNIEIDPKHASQIIVNEEATLGGTLNVIQDPGSYKKRGRYRIITAPSVTNNFTSITGGLPGFVFSLSTLANEVFLNYDIRISTKDLSGNSLKLAKYLNHYAPASHDLVKLAALSGERLNAALGYVSPARNAFATFASQQTAFSLSHIVSDYLTQRRFIQTENPLCPKNECICNEMQTSPFTLWVGGFFQNATQAGEKQNPRFKFDSRAVLIGMDYSRSADVLVGCGFGYANTDLKEKRDAGNASIDYYFSNIYATLGLDDFYIEPALWGIYHRIHNYRHIRFRGFHETAHAKFFGWQMIPHLGFGLNRAYSFGKVEPFVAFDWVVNWEDRFCEYGAGYFNMRQKAHTSSMLQSEIGLRLYESYLYSWGILGVKESVSYINRTPFSTGKVTAAIIGTSHYLSLESLTCSQDLTAVNFELFAQLEGRQEYTISLEYEGEFGANYRSNSGTLKISREF